jgi:hypothetical protein
MLYRMRQKRGLFRSRKPCQSTLDEALLAVARREIETGEIKPDTWDIANQLSKGNEQRAISAYVRMRVRVLLNAHIKRENKKPNKRR